MTSWIIRRDPENGKPLIEKYEDGEKMTVIVYYLRPESVFQSDIILNGAQISEGFAVDIKPALDRARPAKTGDESGGDEWTMASEETAETDGDHPNDGEKTRRRRNRGRKTKIPVAKPKKRARVDQEALELTWDDYPHRHVILKHMFKPSEVDLNDLDYYEDLKREVLEEAQLFGAVESVKVFETHPEGVVAVKFKQGLDATNFVEAMGGRLFDGNTIHAEFYDGYTNYKVEETEDNRRKRDQAWEAWLQSDDKNELVDPEAK